MRLAPARIIFPPMVGASLDPSATVCQLTSPSGESRTRYNLTVIPGDGLGVVMTQAP
jgi:hypothetical protein